MMRPDEPKWKQSRRDYQKRYTLKHYTPFTLMTHKEKDRELIEHLKAKENKSAYMKELIRKDLENAKAGEC